MNKTISSGMLGLQLLTLGSTVFAGVTLQNDRFRIDLKDGKTVVLSEHGQDAQAFTMRFVVLYNPKNPGLTLRPETPVPYTVPTWEAVDPGKAGRLVRGDGSDDDMVGDGFDPSILKGGTKGRTSDLFHAAPSFWVEPKSHAVEGRRITYFFAEHPFFALTAHLELPTGSAYPKLSFTFKPTQSGYYSVGYVGAPACQIQDADEIWQPLIWQEKRFPEKSYLTLAFRCPVPSSFVTLGGITTGVVAAPEDFPFDPLPLMDNSRFGVAVRDVDGKARAMLFAPALGGKDSKMDAGSVYTFAMNLVAVEGDTTMAQERVARDLYGFHDYRNNALGSLNRTVDNLRDYIMSTYSRFDEKYKGCNYSTDAPGAVKNVSSIDPLDLSIVFDDKEMFDHRAYPYMEYMLSRGKFLFTVDETQTIQSPSYRLNGPVAPVSELASLYSVFQGATPAFSTLAIQELNSTRVRNLNVEEHGASWWNQLSLYIAKRDKAYLDAAIAGADIYLQKRVERPQTDFNDPDAGGVFFWTGFAPRYTYLLMLYEASGEERFLKAARLGARRYAQYVWMSPAIPDMDITVNKGGLAPEYWYLKRKGHKQVRVPEESVPAWRLSSIGLTPESSGTSAGHRAIFMANHAPWMLKIGYLTGDTYLMDIARSAVIGRYRNFPGYHINTARTTAYEKKDFPLVGHKDQSVGSFHYNHPQPMLSMLVDFLVTDAYVRSKGKIDFPYNFSEGYAYMQNKAYGAMRGTFYGHDDAYFWMPNGLLNVPDQINYITARGEKDLYVALMNVSEEDQQAEIVFNKDVLPYTVQGDYVVEVVSGDKRHTLKLSAGKVTVPVTAKSLAALVIKKLTVAPRFQNTIADLDASAAWKKDLIDLKEPAGRAMILNLGSANSYAYVFLEYSKHDYKKVELVYDTGSGEKRITKDEFPWEFTVPLTASVTRMSFHLSAERKDGEPHAGETYVLSRQ